MKSIIQVVQHLSPGGIEVLALEILRFKQAGTHMWVVSLEGNKSEMIDRWPRLEMFSDHLIFLNKTSGWKVTTILKLAYLLKTLKVDAIHTHHIGPLIYGGIAARIAGVKQWIHTEHDAWHLENRKRRFLEKSICNLFNPIMVADSKLVARALRKNLGLRNVKVVLNGVDTGTFIPGDKIQARKLLRLPNDVKLVGCAGRMEKEKGQVVLVEALQLLPQDVHVVLAGTGSQEYYLKAEANRLGVSDRIHFLGLVNDMLSFYQSLDCFCLSSFKEGLPLAPLEAQACGVPTILSDTGACSESLCSYTGELVPPGESSMFASAIVRVLKSDEHRTPRSFVCANANARIMADAYTRLCFDPCVGA